MGGRLGRLSVQAVCLSGLTCERACGAYPPFFISHHGRERRGTHPTPQVLLGLVAHTVRCEKAQVTDGELCVAGVDSDAGAAGRRATYPS